MTSRKARKLANIFLNNLIESGKAEKLVKRMPGIDELPEESLKDKKKLRQLVKEAIKYLPDYELLILFHVHVPDTIDGKHVTGTIQRKALEFLNRNYRHEFAERDILRMHLDEETIKRVTSSLKHPVIKILAILGKKPETMEEIKFAIEKGKIQASKSRQEDIARVFGLTSHKKAEQTYEKTSSSELIEMIKSRFNDDLLLSEAERRFGINLRDVADLEKRIKTLEDHQLLELSLLALSKKSFTGNQLSKGIIARTLKAIKEDYDHKTAINIMLERYLGKDAFVQESEKVLMARVLALYGKPPETEEDLRKIKEILDTHIHFKGVSEKRKEAIHKRITRIVKNRNRPV